MAVSLSLATIKQASIVAWGESTHHYSHNSTNGLPQKKSLQWPAASVAIVVVVADFLAPPHETVREEWWLWNVEKKIEFVNLKLLQKK